VSVFLLWEHYRPGQSPQGKGMMMYLGCQRPRKCAAGATEGEIMMYGCDGTFKRTRANPFLK